MKTVIHIGAPKAASTTLQENLLTKHPKLLSAVAQTCLNKDRIPTAETFVLSHEALSFRAKSLPPDCELLYIIRNQYDAIVSAYYKHNFPLRPSKKLPLDKYIQKVYAEFDYYGTYSRFAPISKKFHVLQFEELKTDPVSFAAKLGHILNIPSRDVLQAYALPRNTKLTLPQYYLMKLRHALHLPGPLPKPLKNIILKLFNYGPPIQKALNSHERELVHQAHAEGNRKLQKCTGLPLIGYPI